MKTKITILLTLVCLYYSSCSKTRNVDPITPTPRVELLPLKLNEFVAKNTTVVCPDSVGGNYNTSDWIEVYNPNTTAVDIAGYYITDSLPNKEKFQIVSGYSQKTIIPANGYLIIWCDNLTNLGILHATFKLSSSGEQIGLLTNRGVWCDSLTFSTQTQDISFGRLPDGGPTWKYFNKPTPGTSNQ